MSSMSYDEHSVLRQAQHHMTKHSALGYAHAFRSYSVMSPMSYDEHSALRQAQHHMTKHSALG